MKPIKKMTMLMLGLLTLCMLVSGFMYINVLEQKKAALAKSVESFIDHSEITLETLKH